jgi:LAO/AO transport system kinase
LAESGREEDRELARRIGRELTGAGEGSHRVAVTGPPGVGKSTLIEALGLHAVARGARVAVLAVDPSSVRSGGSVLGDKTRMPALAREESAFIRPSPSRGDLGGVGRATRETITLVEGAGYDLVLVETVGVGQSEVAVAQLVDTFMVLLQVGAGDELQGIKRGILELADLLVVTKADGDREAAARDAAIEFGRAIRLFCPRHPEWSPPVGTCSAVTGAGIDWIWERLGEHRRALLATGTWAAQRAGQRRAALWASVAREFDRSVRAAPRVGALVPELERAVESGSLDPDEAAARMVEAFRRP